MYARELRQKVGGIKTQIRYGTKDVELWTKVRGLYDRYEIMDMTEIEKDSKLPKFDHSLRWKRKQERIQHSIP